MWIRAILWEYNENYEEHRVKGLLLRAQQRHPEAQRIYLIFFKIELENKRKADETLAVQHAGVVYANGKKKFSEIDYFIEMLSIADQFSYARSLQKGILDDMKQHFEHNELLWHTLAQRALNGFSPVITSTEISENIKKEAEEEADNDNIPEIADPEKGAPFQYTLKKRIELCIYTYESSVVVVCIF